MSLIDTGIEKGLIKFDEENNFITYIHQNKKRSYNNPEEKVHPIFMAIAEDIGYDATGRNTNNNELTEIGSELSRFIAHINKTEK